MRRKGYHQLPFGWIDFDGPQIVGEFRLHLDITPQGAIQELAHAVDLPTQVERTLENDCRRNLE
jgi:hypothetical protein